MRSRMMHILVVTAAQLSAQPQALSNAAVTGFGYDFPTPITVAPGQVLALFARDISLSSREVRAPSGTELPRSLDGIRVSMSQLSRDTGLITADLPILYAASTPSCSGYASGCVNLTTVAVQVPFEFRQNGTLAHVFPSQGATGQSFVDALVVSDQVHVLRAWDTLTPTAFIASPCGASGGWPYMRPFNMAGLPCPPMVTHADGTRVSDKSPAKAGEELVAYVVGLGLTSPPAQTGKVVTVSAPTVTQFTLDFNFRPNSLGTRPGPAGADGVSLPVYVGSTAGAVGLYQVNFIVPTVPPQTPPCTVLPASGSGGRAVYSNLTVSIGGENSFDGAGICVAVSLIEEGVAQSDASIVR